MDGLAHGDTRSHCPGSAALARLDQACSQLNDPGLLIWPSLYREALDTSALEGTYGHLADVLEAQLPGFQKKSPETREIYGYMTAAISVFAEIHVRPITVGLLCDAQGEMFQEVEHPPSDRGKVREHQVLDRPTGRPDYRCSVCPAAGRRSPSCGHGLIGPVDRCGTLLANRAPRRDGYYQFETLHPFSDGNGRIGRLAIVLHLLQSGMAPGHPAITISPWLLRRRDEYQDQLFALKLYGRLEPSGSVLLPGSRCSV